MFATAQGANAAQLIINSISLVNSNAPTATIHADHPYQNVSHVEVTPQTLNGTLDGDAVSLFAYCIDIYQYSHTGTFEVVSLADYLGDATKTARISALIGAAGAHSTTNQDAEVQLALWELKNEADGTTPDLYDNNFSVSHISSSLVSAANGLANDAVANAGNIDPTLQIFVAKNSQHQDFLFFSHTPAVPEPATWALMMLGFGAVGAGMRRQRASAKVSFA